MLYAQLRVKGVRDDSSFVTTNDTIYNYYFLAVHQGKTVEITYRRERKWDSYQESGAIQESRLVKPGADMDTRR